jgi:putative tryptophan/tyrosine transport system substrate-binding protein
MSPDSYAFNAAAFRQGLATQGIVERKNVVIEYRWANGDYSLMPSLAKELAGTQRGCDRGTQVREGLKTSQRGSI